MLWTDCCMAETSQHSQREDYETPLKGRSERSHGTFREKAGENKKTICPHWLSSLRWVILCFPGLLAARKIKDKQDPTDNWMGIFNRLSCDLNSGGSHALQDDQSNRKGWEVSGKVKAWPKFPWKTCLSLGWQANIACLLHGTLQSKDLDHIWSRLSPPPCAQSSSNHSGVSHSRPGSLTASCHSWFYKELGSSCLRRAASSVQFKEQGKKGGILQPSSINECALAMRTTTRTKDDPHNQVKAILKQFMLNR